MTRWRSLREKLKAVAAPSSGRGPGTDDGTDDVDNVKTLKLALPLPLCVHAPTTSDEVIMELNVAEALLPFIEINELGVAPGTVVAKVKLPLPDCCVFDPSRASRNLKPETVLVLKEKFPAPLRKPLGAAV